MDPKRDMIISDTEFIIGITSFSFSCSQSGIIEMNAVVNGRQECLKIATDGGRWLNILPEYNVPQVYLSGYWKKEDIFAVRFRWIETVHEKELAFRFKGEKCFITEEGLVGRFPSLGGVKEAYLEEDK